METPESKVDLQNQTCDLGVAAPSEDEFVPGAFCEYTWLYMYLNYTDSSSASL